MERRRTRGVVGEAECPSDPCAIIPAPCGDGTIAASATQHRTTRQSKYGASRLTFATRLTKVGYGREHFDQRTWMCYHEFLLSEGVVTQVEDAEQATPHRKHNPLSLFGAR